MKYAYIKYQDDQTTIKGYTLFDEDDVIEIVKDIEGYYYDQAIWAEIMKEFHQTALTYNQEVVQFTLNNRLKEINKQLTIFHSLFAWRDAHRLRCERKRIKRYQDFIKDFIENVAFDSLIITKKGILKIGKTEKVVPFKKLF